MRKSVKLKIIKTLKAKLEGAQLVAIRSYINFIAIPLNLRTLNQEKKLENPKDSCSCE